jgi:hypothetical protein
MKQNKSICVYVCHRVKDQRSEGDVFAISLLSSHVCGSWECTLSGSLALRILPVMVFPRLALDQSGFSGL